MPDEPKGWLFRECLLKKVCKEKVAKVRRQSLQQSKSTRSERRRERMRRRIIEEADRLYHQNGGEDGGVQSTTVELICEHADISVRTFFRYFDSKLDVIYLDYRQALQELEEILVERLQRESAPRALISASLDHVETFVADEVNRDRFFRAMKSVQFSERRAVWRMRTEERLSELVESCLASHPRRRLHARALVAAYRGVFDQALALWVDEPDEHLSVLVRDGLASIEAAFAPVR